MNLSNRYLFTSLGMFVSIIALFWLAYQFDMVELVTSLRQLDPVLLIPVPLLIFVSFLVRTQRWRLLVEHQQQIRYWPSFSALMIGYFFNNLLPARAGDLARALELGRTEQISCAKVIGTFVTEKTMDLVTILMILTVFLHSYPALPNWLQKASTVGILLAIVIVSLLALFHTTGRYWLLPLLSSMTQRLPESFGDKSKQIINLMLSGIVGMFRPKRALGFLLLTALLWVVEVGIVYIIAVAVDLPLSPGNALFVLLVIAIGLMVPSSPGFVGTYEFFGVQALALIGLTGPSSLAFIILLHLLTLLGSTIIGAICLVLRKSSTYSGKKA